MDVNDVEILLIEDSLEDAELTIRELRKCGLGDRLLWIQDGAEALDFLLAQGRYSWRDLRNAPRLVLLDLKLPKISGLEILRALRSDPQTFDYPVIVLTASPLEQDLVESCELGVNGYVVKPLGRAEFVEAIRQIGQCALLEQYPELVGEGK